MTEYFLITASGNCIRASEIAVVFSNGNGAVVWMRGHNRIFSVAGDQQELTVDQSLAARDKIVSWLLNPTENLSFKSET